MTTPRTPIYLSHSPTPKVRDFALLAGLEAGVRGTMMSAMPLAVYTAFGSAEQLSAIYLCVGIASLIGGLMVPWAGRLMPRRWLLTCSCLCYLLGTGLAVAGGPAMLAAALTINALGTVTFTICLNAYVLDYISRTDLGRNESTRMVYSALPWAIGPVAGVWMLSVWPPLPFLVAGGFSVLTLAMFWKLRLGNGKQIARARAPAPNPLAYLGRFAAQPRLIAGWLFAVIRSCGWWVYIVYLPIYCIENGLGETIGSLAVSGANTLLFATPLMLRLVNRMGVRQAVRGTFALSGLLFVAGYVASGTPVAVVVCLSLAAVCLVMLDVCGGLPFLMGVKPSERTEMAAVYSSFRDVSGILTPAAAWAILLVAPVAGVFAACGGAMWLAAGVAGRMHPRLGRPRPATPAPPEALA